MFELKGSKVTVKPEILLIPEFKMIWDRDKSAGKDMAINEFSFIYFVSDYKSVYRNHYNNDELLEKVKNDVVRDAKWKIDRYVVAAITKYKELQETKSMKALNTAEKALEKIQIYIDNMEFTVEVDPLKAMKFVNDFTKDLSKVITSIQQTRELVEKEIVQKKHQTRGAGELRKRELPKSERK